MRAAPAAGVVLLLLLIVLLLGAGLIVWSTPKLMRGAIERRLSSALGASTRIGALSLAEGGLAMRDVDVDAGRHGRLEAAEIHLQLRWLALARGGRGAVRGVALHGVTVVVPLDAPASGPSPADRVWPAVERGAGEAHETDLGPAAIITRLSGVLRLLADDATVELDSARVLGRRGGEPLALLGGEPLALLDELSASATRGPGGALYTWGRGVVGSRGMLGGAAVPDPVGEPDEETGGGRLSWTAEIDADGRKASVTASLDRVPLASFLPLLPDHPWHRPEQTLLTGRLEVGRFGLETTGEEEALPIRAGLAVRDLALASPMIAELPVVTSVSFTADGRWWPSRRHLQLARSTVEVGEARIQMAARLTPRRMQLEVELPSTPCRTVLSAVPDSVLGLVSEFELDGLLAAGMKLDLDLDSPAKTELDLRVADRCTFTAAPHDARMARFEGRFVHPIRLGDGSPGELVTGPGTEAWTPVEGVSPALIWAVLAHEDAAFFRHSGFAPWAIETALQRNLEEGRFAYGASTVSMQLAKNLFLVRDKTLARKLREVVLTWWLEKQLDKRRILELYLNVIEYAPGVYGIRHAAEHYFGRRPDELTLAESLFLANLLPAPRSHHREYQAGEVSPGTRSAMNVLMAAMARRSWIDRPTLFRGLAEVQALRFHHGEGLRPAPTRPAEIGTAPLPWWKPAQPIAWR